MKKYLNIEINREHSKYPRGLKHYSKHELFENTLFDIDLITYKIQNIWKGDGYGKRDNTRGQEESPRSTKEILRGFVLRLLHEDWDSENRDRENRRIERVYLEMEQRESEESQEGGERGPEESRTET